MPVTLTFPELVASEYALVRATKKPFNSLHEAYAVILEEFDELWEEVRKKKSKRDPVNILKELSQIAAGCQRAAEDLNYITQ